MEVTLLEHVAVNVSNLNASKRFYGEELGLKELPRPQFDFDGAWYALSPTQQLHLIEDAKLVPSSNRQNHHFAFQVKDMEQVKSELQTNGVKIAMGPVTRPDGVTQIFVADPDGYIIELSNT